MRNTNAAMSLIESEQIGFLRFIVTADDILFNAFDACVALHFKNPKRTLEKFFNESDLFSRNINHRQQYFITFKSVKKLAENSPRVDALDCIRQLELIDIADILIYRLREI